MKYKMLVIDMDDTLLTDDHIISEENKEMLFKAQEKEFMLFWHRGDQHQR
jgi:hydroxymethylpyrimidine pyrophosphatase-like HAD family hydrolase